MHRTRFAGLTAPDPDDAALQVDGGSFANRNPDIIDFFLSIGAVTHRHDEHLPLASPTYAPSAIVIPSGGSIESGTDLYFGWTASDSYGGETILSPPTLVSTTEPAPDPSGVLSGVFVSSAGVMPTGTYTYGITVMDAGGGEGVLGPVVTVQRDPGFASGGVLLSGLTGDLLNDGDRWRLWRSDNGGPFNLIAVGTLDAFWDYGIDPVDHAATPPLDSSRTRSTSSVQVTLPMASGASGNAVLGDPHATAINLYLSLDGTFTSPALVGVFPIASAGVTITLTDTFTEPGAPPEVATSIRGANRIDPDTELIDWHWKRPVTASANLPLGSATASGDVRMVISEGVPYTFTASGWRLFPDPDTAGLANVLFEDAAGAHQVLASAVEFVLGSALVVTRATDGHAVVHIPTGSGGPGGSGVMIMHDKVVEDANTLAFTPGTGLKASATVDGTGLANITFGLGDTREDYVEWVASASVASGQTVTDSYYGLGMTFSILYISTACRLRIRIYARPDLRDADLARPMGTPATPDLGCWFEYVSPDVGYTESLIIPAVMVANFDGTPATWDPAISVTLLDSDQAPDVSILRVLHQA
jgi:hypothetical protein